MLSLKDEIKSLKKKNAHRILRVLDGAPEAHIEWGRRRLVNFSSNNYLGLSRHERVRKAAQAALERDGLGGTSSRLLGGSLRIHEELESALASFLGFESALVFSSGYQANVGLIRTLAGAGDTVCIDRRVHASVVDGCRLSQARLQVFRHNDPSHLEKILRRARGRPLVVTEGLFSMDGDVAPLRELSRVCRAHGALLAVDEAHALGVLGEGRGVAALQGALQFVDFYIGTLSKALGAQGGFVCANEEGVDLLRNKSRSFIYTTALSPVCAAGALEALRVSEEEPDRRAKALSLAQILRTSLRASGFDTLNSVAHIVPVLLGTEESALSAARILEGAGIFAPAIRPPTVPKGSCRLRFSLTAGHSEEDVRRAVEALRK